MVLLEGARRVTALLKDLPPALWDVPYELLRGKAVAAKKSADTARRQVLDYATRADAIHPRRRSISLRMPIAVPGVEPGWLS